MPRLCAPKIGLVIAVLLPVTASAQFTYVESGASGILISGYTGSESHVVIPESIDGKTVTGVAGAARFGAGVVSISLPRTVSYLASGQDTAFSLARNLTNIDVSPDNPHYHSVDGVV